MLICIAVRGAFCFLSIKPAAVFQNRKWNVLRKILTIGNAATALRVGIGDIPPVSTLTRNNVARYSNILTNLILFSKNQKVPSNKIEPLQFLKRNVFVPRGRETQNANF